MRAAWILGISLAAGAAITPVGSVPQATWFPAPATAGGTLSIHAATDLPAMAPLIRDFQSVWPGTSVEYVEYVTNDLNEVAARACAEGKPFADLVLSSAVDHLVKLANDGCAGAHHSEMTQLVPDRANWRDEVFGFTFEPAVIVYNKALVPPEDVPQTRIALAELLRTKSRTYRGRVGTYDIRLSGIGYLLAFNDARQSSSTYGRLLESFGRAQAVVRCCTSEILDEIVAGRILIGYNLLGSYAYTRVLEGAEIGIVIPRDYTLVLSRGAMIPSTAASPELGARFLDYLLSPRGQRVARESSFFFAGDAAAPAGVDGPFPLEDSGIIRPIDIGPALLPVQDRAHHRQFIADWSRSMIEMDALPAR